MILQEQYKCSKFAAGLKLNFGHHMLSKGIGSKIETKTGLSSRGKGELGLGLNVVIMTL